MNVYQDVIAPVIELHANVDAGGREYRWLGECLQRLVSRGFMRPLDEDQREALEAWMSGDGDPLPLFFQVLRPSPARWLRREVPGDLIEDLTIEGVSWNDPALMRVR